MPISKAKWEVLHQRLALLNVKEEELLIKAILGSGPGGQKVNKTASTIYLKHLPSGIEIKCGQERSQELNRYHALQQLCDKLDFALHGTLSKKELQHAKQKKQKKRRQRRHLSNSSPEIKNNL